ncbi:MAG TPA: preprotein translocase subunit SecG [Allosphingosinicella sp.]|nr:preprotein translocase subunit SecG [Allosphingosinicella sp.]
MFTFLLIVQTLVAVVMITVILMQRSEGGGLASGGSPSGLMTARGASDFLTRTTAISAALFIALSIALAAVAAGQRGPRTIDPTLMKQAPTPAGSPLEQQSSPFTPNPQAVPKAAPAPAPAEANQTGVPIAQ